MQTVARKSLTKILCIALIGAFLACMTAIPAKAAMSYQYSVSSLSQGKWLTISHESDYNTGSYKIKAAKITVPAKSYITIQTKSTDDEFYVSKSLNKNKDTFEQKNRIYCYGKKSYNLVLPKGTYYILPDIFSSMQIKWKATKVSAGKNYSRAAAQSLAKGKTVKICFLPGQEYSRWYKINLTSKRKLKITTQTIAEKYDSANLRIYDSKGNSLDYFHTKKTKTTDTTSKSLPKGTYYIRFQPSTYAAYRFGDGAARLYTLSWK